jgi:tetratricopeptide (TPR) repeat protein
VDGAIAAFKRNVELYPDSANVYDSLADGLEASGEFEPAMQNSQQAVAVATKTADARLPDFQKHLERLTAAGKSGPDKSGPTK